MNGKKFIGILLEPTGIFDEFMLIAARARIRTAIEAIRETGPVSQRKVANALGIDHNRMNRLTKALDIKELFT